MYMRWLSTFIITLSLILSACNQEKSAEEYIKSGQEYFHKKEWKSAIIEFKNAVRAAPKNPQARALLGKTYVETFSTQAAIKELGRAKDLGFDVKELLVPLGKSYAVGREHQKIIDEVTVENDYSNTLKADILALRAVAYLGLDKKDEAEQALNEARQSDKNSADVRLAWALFEKQKGDTEAQISWLMPLLEKDGGNADAWSMMAEIENRKHDLAAAENAYSRSIALRQYVHVDLARRALIRYAQKNYEGAQEDVNRLKKAGANWPIVGHIDGMLAFQDKNIDLAKSNFQTVLSKAPGYSPSQYMLALIDFDNRNFQNAAALLEQYTVTNPDHIRPAILYANTLLQLNRADEAQILLEKLRIKKPDEYGILSLLGNVYLRQRQTDKAIAVLQEAVKIDPEQARSRLQLGASLLSQESTLAEGQQELIKAIELDPDLLQAELALFRSYLVEKRYVDARKIAIHLDQKSKDSSKGANLIAIAYLAEDQPGKATAQLRKTLKRFPADFLTSHNLARIYLRDDKVTEAKSLYENVLEKQPSHLQTLNQLALIAAREGDQNQIMLRLKQAHERNPDKLSAKIALASQYLRQSEASQAIQILNDVKDAQKELPGYILLMAQAKLGVKEPQHAIRILKSLVAKKPDIPAAHYLLAQGYAQEENRRQLRASLEKTVALSPDNLAANVILSKLDLSEGKFDAFKKRVALLDKTYPDNADVQFLKAKSDSGNRNFGAAIDKLSTLMQQTPHSSVIIDLSKNQWQSGDKPGAIAGLELWVQEHAEDTRALLVLAQFYLADNQNDEARVTYEKLASQKPDNPVVLNNLAWLLKDSNPQQGIKYARQSLDLKPENPFTQDTLAMLYLEVGENGKALELSRRAAKAMPKTGDIQLNYAKVLVANSQKDKARTILSDLYDKTKSEAARLRISDELDKL